MLKLFGSPFPNKWQNLTKAEQKIIFVPHLVTEQPPTIVLHALVPTRSVILCDSWAFVGLLGHKLPTTLLGVVFWAACTHIRNGPMGEDLVIDIRRKVDLKWQRG